MADKLNFELVSPEKQLMSEEVTMVTVPGSEGDFGVLAGHAPFMSTVRPGFLTVTGDGDEHRIFIRGGFAEVTPRGLTILAEEAIPAGQIDRADLESQVKNAEEDVADAKDDETRARAAETLEHLRQVLDGL